MVEFNPLTTSDLILVCTAIVALLAPLTVLTIQGACRRRRRSQRRKSLALAIASLLRSLRSDLVRTRDERNSAPAEAGQPRARIKFNSTALGEIRHYDFLLTQVVVPEIDLLRLPKDSELLGFLDSYLKKINVIEGKGTLELRTVNKLLERLDAALDELDSR